MYNLAYKLMNDDGTLGDLRASKQEAVKWYHEASTHFDHSGAQVNLGQYYGNLDDHVNAVYYYEKAATQGVKEAQSSLGFRYLEGRGVYQDEEKAAELLHQAALQGHMNAMLTMGQLYYRGIGVEINERKARHWQKKYTAAILGAESEKWGVNW